MQPKKVSKIKIAMMELNPLTFMQAIVSQTMTGHLIYLCHVLSGFDKIADILIRNGANIFDRGQFNASAILWAVGKGE